AEMATTHGGCVKVRVVNGTDLVIRDRWRRSSDPYVILKLGSTEMGRTSIAKANLHPTWNEEFVFLITEANCLLKLEIWDHDTIRDDKMGNAEIDLKPLMENEAKLERMVSPSKEKCLYKDSNIVKCNGKKTMQEACLKLRGVEKGLLTLQFEWPV
ncbi:hypothetical protein KI387_035690, partial [Taxus chinensis]